MIKIILTVIDIIYSVNSMTRIQVYIVKLIHAFNENVCPRNVNESKVNLTLFSEPIM